MGGALGGLANMVGDLPTGKVDAEAVEREAAEAAEAAAAEAQLVNAQVREAEAQVSAAPTQKSLSASESAEPGTDIGNGFDGVGFNDRKFNSAGDLERG
jgi:hypothetical protein